MNNVCYLCKKKFKCNGGCAEVNINGRTFDKGMCYCPDCAWLIIKESPTAYGNLREICSRFIDRTREKVKFT